MATEGGWRLVERAEDGAVLEDGADGRVGGVRTARGAMGLAGFVLL